MEITWSGSICSQLRGACCAVQATFYALQATYGFLSPELWTATRYQKSPLQEFTDFLAKPMIGDGKAYMGASEPNF